MTRMAILALALVSSLAVAAPPNPPPASKLQGFARYELRELTMGPPFAGQKPNEAAATRVREQIAKDVAPLIEKWNGAAATDTDKTLVLEPRIEDIRFISGGKRFWAGAMAGDSHIVIKMKITASTGALVAEPEFYQRASGTAGAWSMGGHDNSMLPRVVGLMVEYLNANYPEAVGGRTGYEP